MHSNQIEVYKRTIRLTKEQRAIIIGTLLGDGHLETQDRDRTYRLKIEHSIKQKEYVDWLYQKLRPLVGASPRERTDKAGFGASYRSYSFTTYSLGLFRFYGHQFYPKNGIKVVPKSIRKLLEPLSIAIWYLDDGSFKSNRHKTFIIHSHSFTQGELKRIQDALLNKFGIRTTLNRQQYTGKLYWRIYILSESAYRFLKLIKPVIDQLPSMKYKLGNTTPKK
mgnify:CR=1 FL=1